MGDFLNGVGGPARVVALLPDRGERYLDSVYDDSWVDQVKSDDDAPTDVAAAP